MDGSRGRLNFLGKIGKMVKNDFWLTSGWHLLDKDDAGRLLPTEDFMRAYFYMMCLSNI